MTMQRHANCIRRSWRSSYPDTPLASPRAGEKRWPSWKPWTPQLLILDLMMPEMDGFEVIGWMRDNPRTRSVPIAILSGKILTIDDIKRLEPYQKILFQSKHVLSTQELAASLQQMLFNDHVLPSQTSIVVKHAVAYIHQNYEKTLSRAEIALTLGVSENYLTKIFHQE